MITQRTYVIAKKADSAIESINNELNSNGILSINELILKITSQLMPHTKEIPIEYIRQAIKEKINKLLCENSSIYNRIMFNDSYLKVLNLMQGYIDKILDYYINILMYRRQDFDNQAYSVAGGSGVDKKYLMNNNLVITPEDVNSTINILNEAVRRFYEIYHKKIMTVKFNDDEVIEFRIKEAEIAHLLGLNIKKIVADKKYRDLYGISDTEKDAILNCPPTPEGYKASDEALISILHRIIDMPEEIANFEEDRMKKEFGYQYPSDEDYTKGNRMPLFEKYSKILVKSKAFVSFKPLEDLSIILNMPEGYVKISNVPNAVHSLLISKNFLSDKYKWSTLVANYNKSQNRRYFMSTLLSTREDLRNDFRELKSFGISKKVGMFDDDGSGGGNGVIREFTEAEQIAFLTEVVEDLRLAETEETGPNIDDLDNPFGKGPHTR